MVVFGSLTYFYNFSQHFRDIDEALGNQPGSTKIGDAIQYGAGVAFALNERSSLSLSFTQRFGERTTIRRDGGSSQVRSEEHTSELQSLMRISYAVFCLKKKKPQQQQ